MKNMQILLLLFFSLAALTGCENSAKTIGQAPDFQKTDETRIIGQSITVRKNNREVFIYTKEEIKAYLEAKKKIYDEQTQSQIYLGRKCTELQENLPPAKQKAKYIRAKNAADECDQKYYANAVKMDQVDDKDLPAPSFKTEIDETGFFSVKVPSKRIYVLISPPTSIRWVNADAEITHSTLMNQLDFTGKYIE